jgi:hypothetical protein
MRLEWMDCLKNISNQDFGHRGKGLGEMRLAGLNSLKNISN